jgi:hypothetical protein
MAVYPSYVFTQSVFAQNFLTSSFDAGETLSHSLVNQSSQGFSETSTKKGPLLIASETNPNHFAYLQLSEVNGDLDVYLTETFDAGSSWSSLMRVNDDPIGNGVLQDLLWADFNEQDDLVVCWRDRRNGGQGFASDSDIYGAVKFFNENQFSVNFPITDITVAHDPILENSGNDFMSVVFSGDTLHAVWGDMRNNVMNIFYNKMSVVDPVLDISIIASSDWSMKSIFPNPTEKFIVLDEHLIGMDYQCISADGKVVSTGSVNDAQLTVEALPPGRYVLIVESKKELFSFSFIKN